MNTLQPPDLTLALQWVFGLLVVIVYARERFRSPQALRATTTFWRYWSAWCGYLVAMLGLFVVLGGGLSAVDPSALLTLLGGEKLLDKAGTLPGPLLAALMLTSLLPQVPVLGKIDDLVREWFKRVGNMPFEVRALSAQLRSSAFELPVAELVDLAPELRRFSVEPDWLRAGAGTVRRRWAEAVALFTQVQRWDHVPGYDRYVDENKTVLNDLQGRLGAMSDVLEPAVVSELDREGGSAVAVQMRKKIIADLATLQRGLCDFVSGGVLSGGRSHAQRNAALMRLGFAVEPNARAPLSAHDIVLVMGLVFLAMLFVPLMLRRFFYPAPLEPNLRVMVMVPIIYAIAIVLAVYPKSVWAFARRGVGERRPVAAYALSGVAAAAAAFVVSLVFRFAFENPGNVFQTFATPGAFVQAWNVTVTRWPWLLMTAFVTVAIAWVADDHPPGSGPQPRWLRPLEALGLAGVFAAWQWVVVQLLFTTLTPEKAQQMAASTLRMVVTATVIGACIGWFVPHLHRVQDRRPQGTVPLALPDPVI